MITRDQVASAARNADRDVENNPGGIPGWCKRYGIEDVGLLYVAAQRGLRAAMVLDGQDPTNRTTRTVLLGAQAESVRPLLVATWLDGFAAGFTVKNVTSTDGQ